MRVLRKRITYSNVMATLAVFVALGGASYAAIRLPKNSVGPKQLKKNSVSGPKVRNKSLTGADVDASTLGTVPSAAFAASAASADHAASADEAGNAGSVDGREAADFAPADQVHSPKRVVVDDPTPGDSTSADVEILSAGPFAIAGHCWNDKEGGSLEFGEVSIEGPPGSSFAGSFGDPPDATIASFAGLGAIGNSLSGGRVVAVAPSGEVLSASASVELNDPAGDCIFGVTAIGP